jgi:hypothetical protein
MIDARLTLVWGRKFFIVLGMLLTLQFTQAEFSNAQCQPLPAGTYTVGGTGATYPSLEAAITALQCAGVQGAVTLQLNGGAYEGRYVLTTLPGPRFPVRITTNNTVRFTRSVNSLQPESFVINGGSWQLENLQCERVLNMLNPGPLVRINGGSNHLINHCRFTDASADRRGANQAIWAGQTDSLRLDSNHFVGFTQAVLLAPDSMVKAGRVRGNQWEQYKGPALHANSQQHIEISGNRLLNSNGSTQNFAAIGLEGVEGLSLFNNRFSGAISPTALHIRSALANVAAENRVYNNEIFGFTDTLFSSNLLQSRVLWLEGDSLQPELLLLAHNSIRLLPLGIGQQEQALLLLKGYTAGSDSVGVFNNLFSFEPVSTAALPVNYRAVLLESAPFPGILLDYNAYGLTDTTQAYFATLQPDTTFRRLTDWQAAVGWDAQSAQANPWYANNINTFPTNPSFENLGFLVPWVPTDLNGFFRNAPPDPGVFEFGQVQTDVQLLALVQPQNRTCRFDSAEAVRLVVRNLGLDSLTSLTLRMLLNGQSIGAETFALNLAAGQSAQLQISDSLYLSANRFHQLEIRVDSSFDLRPENDTLRLTLEQSQVQQFPYIEDFEGLIPGAQQNRLGWRNISLQSAAWRVQRGPTPTPFTGPNADATGLATGQYLYFDASAGQAGDTAIFLMDCVDLSQLAVPQFSFRFHGYGADLGSLQVEQRAAGVWQTVTQQLTAQQQSNANAPWITQRGFLLNNADAIRIVGVQGNGPRSDWAIDNIQIAEIIGDELVLDSVHYQFDACSNSGNLNAIFYVRNDGTTGIFPRVGIQFGTAAPVFRQSTRAFGPFDVDTIHFQLPFNSTTELLARFFAANIGDTDFSNDTISLPLQRNGTVSNFPYFDDFETASFWSRTGQNSSWQRTQPAGLALNSAFSGAAAWVTAPTGLPQAFERSAIESPCFDFTNLIKPQLTFAIQYLLGDRMAAQLQYSTNGGSSWQQIGGLFTGENWYNRPRPAGLNLPGAFWSGDSDGWKQAQHDLSFLAGQASVKFRFQFFNDFDTSSVLSALEGLAIDAFNIKESAGAFVYQTSLLPATHCTAQAHMVSTRVAIAGNLQSIELHYNVNGGTEQVLPMTLQANAHYTATIPAQNPGDLVRWRIVTQSDTLLSSPLQSYIDAFLQTNLADVNAPQRSQHSFDAGLAANSPFSIGLAGVDSALGVWFKVEAKRKLELSGLELQITKFTAVDAYLLGEEPGATGFNRQRMQLLGSARGNVPAGFSNLMFETPLLLNAGQTAVIYVQGLQNSDFRVEHLAQNTMVEDNSIRVFSGRKATAPFSLGSQIALPTARLLVRNPADSIRWRDASGQLLANTIQHQRQMPASPDLVVLQLYKNGCAFVDTALFTPSGTIDLGVVALLQPTLVDVQPGVFYPVKVAIRNFGSLDISNYTMAYRVNGVELSITPVERLIPAGDTIHYTFPQSWTWVETGAIVFCAYPRGLSLDVQLSNDTLCQTRFPTSVQENGLGLLKLYPNPSQGHFWIESVTALPAATLTLYDAQGRSIQQQELQLEAGERQRIDCSSWANGLYHYRLQQGQRHSSGRVILQR